MKRPNAPDTMRARRAISRSSAKLHIQLLSTTSRDTRPGSSRATGRAIGPPKSCTTRVNRDRPRPSTKARKRAACASGVYAASAGRSDRPKPRWSSAITRRPGDSPAMRWRYSNDQVGVPWTSTIGSSVPLLLPSST